MRPRKTPIKARLNEHFANSTMTTYATASAQTGGVATQTADYLPNLYAHAVDAEHPAASISDADDVGSDEECYLAATKLALERLLVRVVACGEQDAVGASHGRERAQQDKAFGARDLDARRSSGRTTLRHGQ